eukprot:Hpha_TRINITY_DN15241_c2_g2::TRINITY_DN15241_c2_g2_i1::g.66267::m.66267
MKGPTLRQRNFGGLDSPGVSPIYPGGKSHPDVLDMNPHTQWVHGFGFWVLYIFTIVFARGVFYMLIADPSWGWTLTVTAHGFFSFILLHWIKGSAIGDIGSQGNYDHLTFWEQIDAEHHGTPIRRYFMLVPIFLLIIALNWVRNDFPQAPLLFGSSAMVIIPKMPMFAPQN